MTNLEELVKEISQFETIISEWDESQRGVVVGLKRTIEALHKEALSRLIKSVKQEAMSALRHAVEDEVVYGVLRYHELVKPSIPPLVERIHAALDEVRPGLKSHNGDVELVTIKPPDTVEVKLIGNCSNCPASTLTLSQGIEQAIKARCPEITNVIAVNHSAVADESESSLNSPFFLHEDFNWLEVAPLEMIPEKDVLAVKIEGHSLILHRQGFKVTCYQNACTHLAYPLDGGKVNNGIITCPFHRFQYRLDTGECLTSFDIPLQSYPVLIKGDKVFVQLHK